MAARGEAAGAETFGPLAALRREFTRWQIFRSDTGRFWATRIGGAWRRPPANPPVWWAMTVSGDNPEQLRRELAVQAGSVPG